MMYWVTMWGNAQSTVLPQPAIYAKNITLRYPLFIPFSGNKIRITFDNFCCKERIICIMRLTVSRHNLYPPLIFPFIFQAFQPLTTWFYAFFKVIELY